MEPFALIIAQLSELINVPLQIDFHGCCILVVNQQIRVQIEEEADKERLLIGCFVAEVPPGSFRETIFKQALQENSDFDRWGVFSYSEKNHQLFFFSYLPLLNLDGHGLVDFLEKFLAKVFSWRLGIEKGQLPAKGQTLQKVGPSIFDIRPLA